MPRSATILGSSAHVVSRRFTQLSARHCTCIDGLVAEGQNEDRAVKLFIAMAFVLGIVIGFGTALTLETPRPAWPQSRASLQIRCVPWAPDSVAIARQHRPRVKQIT